MAVFKRNIVDVRGYKNRFNYAGKCFKFKFYSQYAIISSNEAFMELIQLGFIKKMIKKWSKNKKKVNRTGKYKRKKKTIRLKNVRIEGIIGKLGKKKRRGKFRRLWINLWPNHFLTRKSKNARMGKGKGAFKRWILKLRRGVTILECLGYPKPMLQNFVFWFNKKSKLKLCVVENIKLNIRLNMWGSSNLFYLFLQKYRSQ